MTATQLIRRGDVLSQKLEKTLHDFTAAEYSIKKPSKKSTP